MDCFFVFYMDVNPLCTQAERKWLDFKRQSCSPSPLRFGRRACPPYMTLEGGAHHYF